MSYHLSLNFLPKSLGIPFQFDLTVPQQFMVLLCKFLDTLQEEKTLTVYSLYNKFSIPVVTPVTDA
jgi:hypothetical protein